MIELHLSMLHRLSSAHSPATHALRLSSASLRLFVRLLRLCFVRDLHRLRHGDHVRAGDVTSLQVALARLKKGWIGSGKIGRGNSAQRMRVKIAHDSR